MSASFPTSKKTFTAIVDGVTKLIASIFNTGYDEIEAIQTFLGASGNAQSKNASLNALFKYMFGPLPTVTWIDADTIEISACSVVMYDGSNYVIKQNTSALQIALSADLDTGSEASSTWYDVFLIGDGASTTYTAKFVVAGNTPYGATYYKKIFSVRNDGSSNILKFYHQNKIVMLDVPIVLTTTPSNGSWSSALSCASGMPPSARIGIFGLYGFLTSNATGIWIRPNGGTWNNSRPNGNYGYYWASSQRFCFTDGSQQIQYITGDNNPDTISITLEGYILELT